MTIAARPSNMDQNYQQLNLQSLIDLLAEETEKHTKAFISGKSEEVANHREIINSLIAEIEHRKMEIVSSTEFTQPKSNSDVVSDAPSTTTD